MSEKQIDGGEEAGKTGGAVAVYSFGEDVSILDGRSLWDFFEGVWQNGRWYEPPVPFVGLAKSYRMSSHHQSAVQLKIGLLQKHFIPSRWLSAKEHGRLALDYIQMGNLFAHEIRNLAKRPLRYERSMALYTRVGVERGTYYWVKPDPIGMGSVYGDYEFPRDSVIHIGEDDTEQDIYGVPYWLAALNSGLLNESATLFRRRYYKNGGHAGYIFYSTESTISEEDFENIKSQLGQARGQGNFKNLVIHAPGGNIENIKIIPLAEVAAKDEFQGIKNISRDDILAAHRVPPQLIGVIPQNNGGFGDVRTAMDVFFENEILPLMEVMRQLNEITGLPVVDYKPYERMMVPGGA